MSLPPQPSPLSTSPLATTDPVSQPTAITSTVSTNRSEPPPLDDNTVQLEPPLRPYASEGTSSPSARTSFTRVDVLGEEEAEAAPPVMSQDHPNPPSASPPVGSSGQSAESQGPPPPPPEVQQDPIITETESVVPMASTSVPTGVDGPSSSSSSQKLSEQPQVPQTPQAFLTFLLVSGKRRTMSFEPETTIGRVKELIWNAWPSGPSLPIFLYRQGVLCFQMRQNGKTNVHLPLPTSVYFTLGKCCRMTIH